MLKIYVAKDYQDLSRKAANIVSAQIITKPDSLLGLATGSTPIGMYDQLVDWYRKGDLDFSDVKSVNLDEYRGLTPDNDQSYSYFMHHHLFDRVNIDQNEVHLPDGTAADAKEECRRYENLIRKLGLVDLQVLGLGHNGHIGFNEPAEDFSKSTHVVDLTESTIHANRRFFEKEEDVPRQAFTMGIGTIMRSKKILLIVSGADKAAILNEVFLGKVTPKVPASTLQMHPDVTLVVDEAGASELSHHVERVSDTIWRLCDAD